MGKNHFDKRPFSSEALRNRFIPSLCVHFSFTGKRIPREAVVVKLLLTQSNVYLKGVMIWTTFCARKKGNISIRKKKCTQVCQWISESSVYVSRRRRRSRSHSCRDGENQTWFACSHSHMERKENAPMIMTSFEADNKSSITGRTFQRKKKKKDFVTPKYHCYLTWRSSPNCFELLLLSIMAYSMVCDHRDHLWRKR